MRRRFATASGLVLVVVVALLAIRACSKSAPPDRPPARAEPVPEAAPGPVPDRAPAPVVPKRVRVTPRPAPSPAPPEPTAPLVAAPGEDAADGPLTNADAAEIGPLTTVVVTVLAADGAPAAGARVILYENHPHGGYDAWREQEEHTTDLQGSVTIDGLDGQAVHLRATRGEDVGITPKINRFRGRARRTATIRLAPGVRRHGTVVDIDDEAPIEGAQVGLFFGPWSHWVETAADGTFVSDPVTQETLDSTYAHRVRAGADGTIGSTTSLVAGRWHVRLTPETIVRCRLVDPQGQPVTTRHGYVKTPRGPHASFRTDADGRLEVSMAVGPGSLLEVWPAGAQVVRFGATRQRLAERDLGEVIVLPSGIVTGAVVDALGRPVSNASVGIRSVAGGIRLDWDDTDDEGLFELENVGDGEHMITAKASGRDAPEVQLRGVRAGDRGLRIVVHVPSEEH